MELGAAYYPEHHKPSDWPVDYEKIREAGIRYIRIAEFAWSQLEPSNGVYDWSWLDDSIELAASYGLKVVLCTPTACPPVWLVERHPEVLPVHKSGRTVGFGARQHRSYFSPRYLAYADRITERMAERYGSHPNVAAWQLDNEFGGETKFDYCDCARRAFHAYLAERYGSIGALNERWGTAFWSQRYERFDQIPLPAPIESDVMMWQHPSLELEFARFSSQGIVSFARRQADILRRYVGSVPVTTNAFMFRWGDSVDWSELFQTLDVVGMDIYSDKPHELAFYADACRGVLNRPFWMMEYGTGSSKLGLEMADFANRGCERFFLFKLKPFPWGQEQGAGGPELLTITGEPAPNYYTVQRFAERAAEGLTESPDSKPSVALYYDFESSWAYRISVSDRLSYADYIVDTVYQAMYNRRDRVDVIYRPEQIEDQMAVVLPLHLIYDAELEERLNEYVKKGGRLICTGDFFRKDESNVFLTKLPRIFAELFDWRVNNFVTDVVRERNPILHARRHANGGGAWLVARDTTNEEWAEILKGVVD